jgi:hypothetical protein
VRKARLQDVRLEFNSHTVYGKADGRGRFDLHLCGHGMGDDDRRNAQKVVHLLKEQGADARNRRKCGECSKCYMGCFSIRRRPVYDSLDGLGQAVRDALDEFGGKLELTFALDDRLYIFSTEWQYYPSSFGAPGYFYLNGVWTYFLQRRDLEAKVAKTESFSGWGVRNIPGVSRLETELIPGGAAMALDIHIPYSREILLEDCLAKVAEFLAPI